MTERVEFSENVLLSEISQWNNNVQVIEDKLVVKINEI